jgi:apolipoprotein N-acyltransferase
MMRSDLDSGAGWRARWWALAGIVASAVLLAVYARGGPAWMLGFCVLVPWLLTLNGLRTLSGALLSGWLMSMAYVLAVFAWFGSAVGTFTGAGTPAATLALCALAPLLQLQVLAYAATRHLVGQRSGPLLRALAAASAWVACEWICTKLLGDTLGHGLYPSAYLRQLADLGGAAGLSFLLILINEALALALTRRRAGARALLAPLTMAATLLALMFGYGAWRLSTLQATLSVPALSLRIGMVQTAIIDYEKLRQEKGAYAVVREVLDTHFALSRAAIEQHDVDALLWSETVYPTTFGHPRSADGAALDQEIIDFVGAAGVPLVFGTYDIDDGGEYNAAAFIEPGTGAPLAALDRRLAARQWRARVPAAHCRWPHLERAAVDLPGCGAPRPEHRRCTPRCAGHHRPVQ